MWRFTPAKKIRHALISGSRAARYAAWRIPGTVMRVKMHKKERVFPVICPDDPEQIESRVFSPCRQDLQKNKNEVSRSILRRLLQENHRSLQWFPACVLQCMMLPVVIRDPWITGGVKRKGGIRANPAFVNRTWHPFLCSRIPGGKAQFPS